MSIGQYKIKFEVNGKIKIARLGGKNVDNFKEFKLCEDVRESGFM